MRSPLTGAPPQDFRYDYTLTAKVKGTPETLYASGECGSTTAISCSVECDGGGVELEPRANDPDTLFIRLDTDYTYIRMRRGAATRVKRWLWSPARTNFSS